MSEEKCLLEDGYFVCVKKAGLKATEILTALLAEGASFEGDVGKLSFLPGVTVPNEIPTSPAFIAKDGEGFTITPGGWMPFCPLLYGAEGLLPDQRELLKIGGIPVPYSTLTTDEILQSATTAHSLVCKEKGKRWTHLSRISTTSHLSQEDVDALFAIFPHVQKDKRHEYVIYMINSLHGAASAALNEIKIPTQKTITLSLMQNVAPNCENVDPDGLQAVLVPYYSAYGVGGATTPIDKTYVDMIEDLSAPSLSRFSDLGDRVEGPKIPFVANTCASDVFKMFPGGIDQVDNGTDMLELCRALALGVPGKTTTARQAMEPNRFNMVLPEDPDEISRPGIDLSTLICLSTLYTARMPDDEQMVGADPRNLHILNMLERMRTLREKGATDGQDDGKIIWWLRKLIDDAHASTLFTYMDTAAAIHRIDYINLVQGKPEDRKGLQAYVKKTYQRPLVTMPDEDPLVRLWVAVKGDFVMYAALVRAMERDVWRFRADTNLHTETSMPLPCSCTNQTCCIHRIVKEWCSYTQVDSPGQGKNYQHNAPVASSSQGLQKRMSRKRTANGIPKELEKLPHDSMFMGTLRCASAYDVICSPVGNTNLKPKESTSGSMFKNEKTDNTEKFKNHRSLSILINGILKEVSMGMEEENESLYDNGMSTGHNAMKTTMAKMGDEKRNNLLFGTSPHVRIENGKASWEISKEAPIYTTLGNGKKCKSMHAEVVAVTKTAANALLDKIISAMHFIQKKCAEVKNNEQNPLTTDMMWKTLLRCDPNLNQYDAMNVPLMTATMMNILRPVVTALKAQGMLFLQTDFKRDFPYYDRTKLDDVLGDGGNVQYGMNGKFLPPQPQIAVFTHSNPPACIPCLWKGAANQRMTINTCRIKGVCKGKDVPNPWNNKGGKKNSNQKPVEPAGHTQSQNNPATDGLKVNEDSTVKIKRQLLAKPFVFETENDDELAYMDGLQEMEDVVPWKEGPHSSSWIEGVVFGAMLDVLEKCPDHNRVLAIARKTLCELPRWRYVCKTLDLIDSVYSPSGFFIPGNEQGLPVFKYLLVYLNVCRLLNVETFYSKPTYTACGFLGPCTKVGRSMNYVLNYDMLCAQDAPYVTLPMDYKLYGSNLQSKVFGGPCMAKAPVSQSGILCSMSSVFSNKSKAPYFMLMTPCVPFPERNSEDKSTAMLRDLSFEEILSRLHTEKWSNLVARACGYDNLRCAASAEDSELTEKLLSLSISTKQAETIAKLLKATVAMTVEESTEEDGILMSWDENYQLSEDGANDETSMHQDNVYHLISDYQ